MPYLGLFRLEPGSPLSWSDFFDIALKLGGTIVNHKMWSLATAVAWSLWLTGNEMVFNQHLCDSHAGHLQGCGVLGTPEESST